MFALYIIKVHWPFLKLCNKDISPSLRHWPSHYEGKGKQRNCLCADTGHRYNASLVILIAKAGVFTLCSLNSCLLLTFILFLNFINFFIYNCSYNSQNTINNIYELKQNILLGSHRPLYIFNDNK